MMKTYDPQRRTVLRGTLAAGISLLLFSCDRRPQTSATGMQASPVPMSETPPSPPPMAAAAPTETAPAPKVSKTIAHYQEQPKGDQKCATCANFIPESRTCKVVEGPISPEGWCVYWMKKA